MALYRQFRLANALSDPDKPESYYNMADPSQNHFFSEPKGLGLQKNYKATKQGNSEEIDSVEFEMLDITGNMIFYGKTNEEIYQAYQDFINFAKFKPLRFIQLPANINDEYYCEVLLVKVEKEEIDPKTQAMKVPVTFHRTTQWIFKDNIYELKNEIVGEGKHYDLVRDYYYAGSQLNNIKLNNPGTDEVGFRFEIDGEVTNPELLVFQNGAQQPYGLISLIGTFTKVRVISDKSESIYLENNGEIIGAPYNRQNFNAANGESFFTFFKLKPGESTAVFSCNNIDTFDGTVKIIIKGSAATV